MRYLVFLFLLIAFTLQGGYAQTPQTNPFFSLSTDTLISDVNGNPGLQNVVITDRNKQAMEVGQYLNGQRHGQWVLLYQPDSLIHTLSTYNKGKLNGLYLSFEKNLQLEDEANYTDGKLDGVHRTYKHGRLEIHETYRNGQLHGPYTKYHTNGKIQEQSTYQNGVKTGKSVWYYDNGELLTEYNYSAGTINGKVWSYYKDKTPRSEVDYLNNEMNGTYKGYYENGNPKEEGKYISGKKNGEWKYYTPEGKPEKTILYKMNEVVKETPLNK